MMDIKKAEASQPEVNPTPQDRASTESDAASSCEVKVRQHNKTEGKGSGFIGPRTNHHAGTAVNVR
jgi:hypothetical protein